MEKESTKKMTREDALRRLEEARKLKREYVKELENITLGGTDEYIVEE